MHNQKLRDGCKKLSLTLTDSQFEKLEAYIDCIMEFNKTYNIMKADTEDELAVNHILDSLAGAATVEKEAQKKSGCTIADIGSGGGCPGIPLAVYMEHNSFVLVERMEKRCAFLEGVVSKLNLSNVKVLCSAADSVVPSSFDIEVFRAFHPFDKKIIKLLRRMLKPEGTIIAYKARSERIEEEMLGIKDLVPTYKKIPLTVPFLEDHERNLVIIQ